MINSLVRMADLNDHQQLSNLIFFETHLHRHLDWRSPLEWLGAPFYWVLEEGKRARALRALRHVLLPEPEPVLRGQVPGLFPPP